MSMRIQNAFYDIQSDSKSVFAMTDYYIPFEAKGIKDERRREIVLNFKDDLQKAQKALSALKSQDEILFAQYFELGKERFYDLENMLFHNIKQSGFLKSAQFGLAFAAFSQQEKIEVRKILEDAGKKYLYRYQLLPRESVFEKIENYPILAQWDGLNLTGVKKDKAGSYWKVLRENQHLVKIQNELESPEKDFYAMLIHIKAPKFSVIQSMKPMLDGVVCAFHSESDSSLPVLKKYCMENNCLDLISRRNKIHLFGERDYLRFFRNESSYQWNPADERCKFAVITLEFAEEFSFSGKIADIHSMFASS